MLEKYSDAMLSTRASPAVTLLALLDEIEDLLRYPPARSTISSICSARGAHCMHAVPFHLRESRPSSKPIPPP